MGRGEGEEFPKLQVMHYSIIAKIIEATVLYHLTLSSTP